MSKRRPFGPCWRFAIFVALVALAMSCGGDSGTSPDVTVPVNPAASASSSSNAAANETPQYVSAVSQELSSLTLQALRQAVGVPAVASLTALGIQRAASTGAYRVDCPVSGYMEMMQVPDRLPFIGEVALVNVKEVYRGCAYSVNGTSYTTNGELNVNGSYWIAENVPQAIEVSGELTTTPGETCPIEGRVMGAAHFSGTVCTWPITVEPPPPPSPPPAPAGLLSGRWAGRATFRDGEFGCTGTANFTFQLGGSGNNVNGTYTYTIVSARGPEAFCSRSCSNDGLVGCGASGSLTGTARGGSLNLNADGLLLDGEYRPDGEWMGGGYRGSVLGGISVSGDWQAVR